MRAIQRLVVVEFVAGAALARAVSHARGAAPGRHRYDVHGRVVLAACPAAIHVETIAAPSPEMARAARAVAAWDQVAGQAD